MKKTISISLVVVLCLVLTSCSSFVSRNEIREQADEAPILHMSTYADMREENEARAKAEFDGKVFSYTARVYEINDGYCYVEGAWYMNVYLEEEDLVKLNKGETYTFVGVFEHTVLTPNMRNAIVLDK